MLSVKNISFGYGNKTVLDNISFDISKGSLCGLLGPNGSGKSTLIKCCLNLLRYPKGNIEINGTDIKKLKPSTLAKQVAYVPQEHKLSFSYTVRDIVLMGRSPHMGGIFGLSREDYTIADNAIDMLGISHLADKPSNELSGGERQMTLIARAAAQQTPLILLDEPTSALDFSNQIMIWKLLRKIAETGVTILSCSHDPNHILWYSDEIVALSKGTLATTGKTTDVLDKNLLSTLYNNEYTIDNIGDKSIIFPKNI